MKSLRRQKRWSQEQLAQLSGLNVRTIQRVEKGDRVGIETLKALASVFEVTIDELISSLEVESATSEGETDDDNEAQIRYQAAQEKVQSIKSFYVLTAFLVGVFLVFMLPNYNGGENLGALVAVFLCFSALIATYGFMVFQPFGEEWEKSKISGMLSRKNRD